MLNHLVLKAQKSLTSVLKSTSNNYRNYCSPVSIHFLLDVAVKQSEEMQCRRSFNLPVELFQDDLLHPYHVRNSEAVLADSDQIASQRNILLLLRGLHSNVEAAKANTGQMFGLDL